MSTRSSQATFLPWRSELFQTFPGKYLFHRISLLTKQKQNKNTFQSDVYHPLQWPSLLGGVYHTPPPGQTPPCPLHCWDTPRPVNRMADRCKNITLLKNIVCWRLKKKLRSKSSKIRELFVTLGIQQ